MVSLSMIRSDINLTYVTLLVTENCNQKCTYCYDNFFAGERVNSDKPEAWLSVDMLPDIIAFVDRYRDKSKPIKFHYIGGEPLLNFEFVKASAEKLYLHYGPATKFYINTNLTILTDEMIDMFVQYHFIVTTSIDGRREAHNRFRANWDLVVRNLTRLTAKYVEAFGPGHNSIRSACVVSAANVSTLLEDFLAINRICPLQHLDFNAEDPDWTSDKLEELRSVLQALAKAVPSFLKENGVFQTAERGPTSTKYCCNPHRTITIGPRGRLYFCHRLVPKSYVFTPAFTEFYGDIYSDYSNTDYFERMDAYEKNIGPECAACKYLKYCHGGCRALDCSPHPRLKGIGTHPDCTYQGIIYDIYEELKSKSLNSVSLPSS